ncbi:MAG TPA: V-type ATP synthase subunit D [Actinomycetales bacterium]|nr:V-type ATP synthase subunit D [Actinomycetales bacterium]
MWLRRRLMTAERGREQLDRKLRILIPERQRLETRAARRHGEWAVAYAQAQTWLLRASLLGGQDALRSASAPQLVDVTVLWTSAMGLAYPEDATVSAAGPDAPVPAGNAALGPAARAFRAALLAGSRAAAADEAVRRLDAEIAVTRRRMRALDKHWLPWLRAEISALELTLEQTEHEDVMRLRRSVLRQGGGLT